MLEPIMRFVSSDELREAELFFRDLMGWSQPTRPRSESTEAWPSDLVLLEHFHTPRRPDPATPGSFITGAIKKLEVADMNPGFISATDTIVTDTSSTGLHHCLGKRLTSAYSSYLHGGGSSGASKKDNIAVALVDLTGNKLSAPELGGWGVTVPYYGASTPKILAVYAVFQLRADLRQLADSESITDPDKLRTRAVEKWRASGLTSWRPSLRWLFKLTGASNLKNLEFSAKTKRLLAKVDSNERMSDLIIKVGYPYIASVAIQSGLFHETRGGLWLRKTYADDKPAWGSNPIWSPKPVRSHNLNALATATYFTLLAQGRLVDAASSAEIKTVLSRGCVTSWFPSSLKGVAVARKCGLSSDGVWTHDAALIERSTDRFVAVLLTRDMWSSADFGQILEDMAALVVNNNQTPKVAC
jgi:hypothetical protein